MTTADAVVIGVGNEAAGDDALGLEVVRALSARRPSDAPRFVETDGEPTRLLDVWEDAASAIVVDAARLDPAQDVVVLDGLRDTIPHDERRSGHGLGLGAAIELGRRLGRLPDRLVVVAVRGERFAPGFGLSAAARRHAREALDVVAELVGPVESVGLGLDGRDRDVDVAADAAGKVEPEPT